jgi:hypothetical protein
VSRDLPVNRHHHEDRPEAEDLLPEPLSAYLGCHEIGTSHDNAAAHYCSRNAFFRRFHHIFGDGQSGALCADSRNDRLRHWMFGGLLKSSGKNQGFFAGHGLAGLDRYDLRTSVRQRAGLVED